jgi:putative AdoMet-dependent methyltransferase
MNMENYNNRTFPWLYDEMKQVGVDYTNVKEIEVYDKQMAKLRDIKQETASIIKLLGIKPEHVLIEFGTGTGEFALQAARHCRRVIALDVSVKMLEYAEKKKKDRGNIGNVDFYQGGFLTYQHTGAPVDFVVSQLALHHLPDFWKQIALKRIYNLLTEGGRFYLRDTVYSFAIDHYQEFFDQWLSETKVLHGDELARDIETAIREEYSTCNWIMEGLLTRAGFIIEHVEYTHGFLAQYVCKK